MEKEISREKHSRGQAVHLLAEVQLAGHLQLGKANIDAVKVRHDVKEKEKRHEPSGELGDNGGFGKTGRIRGDGIGGQE